jgi:hypothetical protein
MLVRLFDLLLRGLPAAEESPHCSGQAGIRFVGLGKDGKGGIMYRGHEDM